MSEKTSDILVRVFVVLYIALCVCAVVFGECKSCDKNNTCNVQNPQENTMIPAKNASIIWLGMLNEGGNPENPADYPVTGETVIDATAVAEILDAKYYMEQPEAAVMAPYIPQFILKYQNDDKTYQLMYSFTNGEVMVFEDGQFTGMKYLYKPQSLSDFIQGLN